MRSTSTSGSTAGPGPAPSRRHVGLARLAGALVLLLAACGSSEPKEPPLSRHSSVLIDGCALDPWQRTTLASEAARGAISEVVLLCLTVRDDGQIGPLDAAARAALAEEVQGLRQSGYEVSLGVTARSDAGADFAPERIGSFLRSKATRDQATAGLAALAKGGTGLDVALPRLLDGARADLGAWVGELSAAVRPGARLGILAPPSSMEASDVPGAAAYDLRALAPQVDRIRLMTVDYSCCGDGPGPGTAVDWIDEVTRFALARVSMTPISFTLPLYGTGFEILLDDQNQARVEERPVTFLEALGLAGKYQTQIQRTSAGALHFAYTTETGAKREVWFDDARSMRSYLHGLDGSVPAGTGVFYYGLGAEDPALWDGLPRRR